MKPQARSHDRKFVLLLFALFTIIWSTSPVFSYPVKFTDFKGNKITIEKRPECVVSLVPSITEIIFKIGAGDAIKGVTYHSTYPSETSHK
ncbi:MAG: hypothetical protein JRF08_06880, partial [Deltaproteobacteria bacterium]|nr:hypothetical protein [Deltaproteobacteria bacterium]